jgi:hypothetical protein
MIPFVGKACKYLFGIMDKEEEDELIRNIKCNNGENKSKTIADAKSG